MTPRLLIALLAVLFVFNLKAGNEPEIENRTVLPVHSESGRAKSMDCRWSLRTNMLYDAALIPNISAEFMIADGWSAGAGYMHAWWKNSGRNFCWRIYGLELNVRKYIHAPTAGRCPAGHHVGIYGHIFTYDFQLGKKGYMAGKPGGNLFDRAHFDVGMEYGYSLPVSHGLNIDFSLGVGYMRGIYYEYIRMDGCNVWQSTKMQKWLGPTKAEVSLVWYPGSGRKSSKGGRR